MSYDPNQYPNTPASPIRRTVKITPSDSATINPTKCILVVTAGTIVVRCSDDTAPQTFANVPAYTELAMEAVQVLSTGTTSTDIRACY